jgi:hypothetical protein
MADIKAKDIAIASSVASNDLILGSSIAGTTANVTVETVGNFILNNFPKSDLGNQSILPYAKDIHNKLKVETIFNQEVSAESANVYSNVGQIRLTTPSFLFMQYSWGNSLPLGILLSWDQSASGNTFSPVLFGKNLSAETGKNPGSIYCSGFVPAGTFYIFVKAANTAKSNVMIQKVTEMYT